MRTSIFRRGNVTFLSRLLTALFVLACLVSQFPPSAAAQSRERDQPPEGLVEKTRAKIDEARGKFSAEADAVDADVYKRLDGVADRAKRQGDHETLTKLDGEREAYEANHKKMPTLIRTGDLMRRRVQAVKQMVSAYDRAITDLTRYDLRGEADSIAQEKAKFLDTDGDVESMASKLLRPGSVLAGQRRRDDNPTGGQNIRLHIDRREGMKIAGRFVLDADRTYNFVGLIDGNNVKLETLREGAGAFYHRLQGTVDDDTFNFRFDGTGVKGEYVAGTGTMQRRGTSDQP